VNIAGTGRAVKTLIALVAAVVAGGTAFADVKSGYTGSAKCAKCHKQQMVSWSETLHSRFMRSPTNDATLKELHVFSASAPVAVARVAYVLGNMHKLVFLENIADRLVPIEHQYDVDKRAWEPFSRDLWDHHAGSRKEDSSNVPDWYERCAGCHTTGYDPKSRTFVESSIACEHCHGPGAKHSETLHRDDIVNPATASDALRIYVCAQCHSRGEGTTDHLPYPTGFLPGSDLSKVFVFDAPVPDKATDMFWENGAAKQHHSQFNELRQSKHFENGLACFDCHQVHRFRNVKSASTATRLMAFTDRYLTHRRSQFVCLRCHDANSLGYQVFTTSGDGKLIDQHTKHPPAISKSPLQKDGKNAITRSLLCSDCHMPRLERETSGYNIHSHRFQLDTSDIAKKANAPSACLQCHTDKDRSWLATSLKAWEKNNSSDGSKH